MTLTSEGAQSPGLPGRSRNRARDRSLHWSITAEGAWRHVPTETTEALGFTADEFRGNLVFDYVHPEDLDRRGIEPAERRRLARASRFPGDPARSPASWFEETWELGLGVQLELLAVRLIARSLPRIPPEIGVCINASPPTMAASGFMTSLGAQAERVTVELTEHREIRDYRDLRATLAPLQRAGGTTAIDDVGAGYASLAHIVKLDPDWIKLDISLTNEIVDNPIAHSLARALVSFAEGMGIGVIAEGIETEDERDALTELGVRFGQGFHLGMPAPLNEALGSA